MRLLVYGLNFSPELTGIGKYSGEMAEWLAARGHEVRVVTAPPYYPQWRVREDYRGRLHHRERGAERLTVYRCPLWVPKRPNGVKRVLHLVSFMLSSLPVMVAQVFWRPQVVFTVEPTSFCAPVALAVARLTGAEAWLHVQDFEVDAAFDLGLLPARGPVHALALLLESVFTTSFDRVSSISPKMVERSLAKGVESYRATLFPNWVDVDAIHPMEGSSYRPELGLEGKIVVLYSGNMGAKQGLEVLAPLAESFAGNPEVHFVFCGDGAYRPKLEGLVAGVANVTLLPLQPVERLNELLNLADIHLLPQRGGAADLVMPSKLTGMLASGRPVVATADAGTQVARVVEECGIAVPSDDLVALHGAVKQLVEERELRLRLGERARVYAVERLGKQSVLLQFERDLLDVVREAR